MKLPSPNNLPPSPLPHAGHKAGHKQSPSTRFIAYFAGFIAYFTWGVGIMREGKYPNSLNGASGNAGNKARLIRRTHSFKPIAFLPIARGQGGIIAAIISNNRHHIAAQKRRLLRETEIAVLTNMQKPIIL